jgi:hypothetical protein
VKLATFRADGQDKVGIVHANDTKLFDLAAAAARDRNNPAFTSMLALIDAGEAALGFGSQCVRETWQRRIAIGECCGC